MNFYRCPVCWDANCNCKIPDYEVSTLEKLPDYMLQDMVSKALAVLESRRLKNVAPRYGKDSTGPAIPMQSTPQQSLTNIRYPIFGIEDIIRTPGE